MHNRQGERWRLAGLCLSGCLAGCQGIADLPPPPIPSPPTPSPAAAEGVAGMPAAQLPNPLSVPVRDRQFFWNQLIDTVDDYFDIESEQQVQVLGNVVTEGRIQTQILPGATALEPWRWDSTPGFERWHATFQSLRRQATVTVDPQGGHYVVNLVVNKYLEDVNRPAQGTPGSALPRHDRSLIRNRDQEPFEQSRTLGWIPIGRDTALEQEMLRELTARLFDPPR